MFNSNFNGPFENIRVREEFFAAFMKRSGVEFNADSFGFGFFENAPDHGFEFLGFEFSVELVAEFFHNVEMTEYV